MQAQQSLEQNNSIGFIVLGSVYILSLMVMWYLSSEPIQFSEGLLESLHEFIQPSFSRVGLFMLLLVAGIGISTLVLGIIIFNDEDINKDYIYALIALGALLCIVGFYIGIVKITGKENSSTAWMLPWFSAFTLGFGGLVQISLCLYFLE